MKLAEVQIHNFRGIHDAAFSLCDCTLLVGPNNSGKSTVIDALRAFYEKDKFSFKKDADFPLVRPSGDESWIEIEFALTDDETASLAARYRRPNNRLRVRKYFKASKPEKNGCIFGFVNDSPDEETQFYGDRNVQLGKLGEVVYIPAVSTVGEHTKLTGPSALRDLLSSILEEVVDGHDSYVELQESFRTFADSIKEAKTSDDRCLSGFENDLSQRLRSWGISFSLRVTPPSVAEIVKQSFDYACRDESHGSLLRPEQFGSGFQRQFIYSLIEIGAKYRSTKRRRNSKEFSPQLTLLLFEEPEAFLHPPQQVELASNLQSLGKEDYRQVVCSTHSSHFVSRNMDDIPSIVRMKRTAGRVEAFQVRQPQWQAIVEGNHKLNLIPGLANRVQAEDWTAEMEAVKYCLWMNPDRASVFFANNVLLVEGATEQALLSRLIVDKEVASPPGGLYVLDCMGKYNMHRFMNMLSCLGTPHAVLYDDDGYGSSRHDERSNEMTDHERTHRGLHDLIAKSRDPVFTRLVEPIHKDLETFLGVNVEGRKRQDHRKPQHVMYLFSERRIDKSRLDALCQIVGRCVAAMGSGGAAAETTATPDSIEDDSTTTQLPRENGLFP